MVAQFPRLLIGVALLAAAPVAAQEFVAAPGRAVCRGENGYANAEGAPRTFLWRAEWLAQARARAQADPDFAQALRKKADAALARGPYSVTHKTALPAGGSRNDYYSIGPYWWPSPGKRGGLPYERRDGKVNPESRDNTFDKDRIGKFANDVTDLAIGWHVLGDRRYAAHAAALLRTWFLDPTTRMNPNLNYGQAVPGRSSGRAEGVIELRALQPVVEAIGLVGTAEVLAPEEQAGLEAWFGQMVQWLATSPIGRTERSKSNNHGLYFDALLMQFALFARLEPVARHVATEWPARRIDIQFGADGGLPAEHKRTRSLHYSFFALEAAAQVAGLAECVGRDLWRARGANGVGLEQALAFHTPFAAQPGSWRHPEQALTRGVATPALRMQMARPLRLAAWGYAEPSYEAAANGLSPGESAVTDWLSTQMPATSEEE